MKKHKEFFEFIKPVKSKILLLGIISFIVESLTLASPFLLKNIVDKGIVGKNMKLFLILIAVFFVMTTVWRLSDYLYSLYGRKVKNAFLESVIRERLQKFIRYYPLVKLKKKDTGYFLSRIYEEPAQLSENSIDFIIDSTNFLIFSFIGILFLLYLSTYATIIMFFISPVVYYLASKFSSKIKHYTKKTKHDEAIVRDVISNTVQSLLTIRVFNLEKFALEHTRVAIKNYLSKLFHLFKTDMLYDTLNRYFFGITEMLVITVGGYLVIIGKMTIGALLAFMQTFYSVLSSITRLAGNYSQFVSLQGAAERIKEFDDELEERIPQNVQTGKEFRLQNVYFSYNGKYVLENLSLTISQGEKALIIGENGSGKSTLLTLMTGLVSPQKGTLTKPEKVVLMPEKFLSIPIKDHKIIDERGIFDDIIKKFGLLKYQNKKPQELSAGERKKFAIALTLMKNSDAYLFDEPLANIDKNTRSKIMDTIFDLTEGKILVCAMHEGKEYENRFDKIVKLSKNRG